LEDFMLKKIILIAGVFGTMATLSAVGCSSSSTTGGNGAAEGDSGSKSDSGKAKTDGGKTTGDGGAVVIGKDGGTISHFDGGGSDGGPITLGDGGVLDAPACYDVADAVSLTDVGAAVAHQNVCNTTQISGYLTACVGSGATDATCTPFMTANAACSTCIGGPSTSGATGYDYPVLVPIDSAGDVVANVAGCFAALSTGDATCKTNFPALIECEQSACTTCSSDADNSACLDYADADTAGCPSFVPVDDACNSALTTSQASGANQTACGAAAADFDTAYTAVAGTLCGP
jgi:hypothetical protein